MLDDYGLVSALRSSTGGFARRTGIQVTSEAPTDLSRASREFETELFRVAQECLNNIHKRPSSLTLLSK